MKFIQANQSSPASQMDKQYALFSVAQMNQSNVLSVAAGVSSHDLMEQSGSAVATAIAELQGRVFQQNRAENGHSRIHTNTCGHKHALNQRVLGSSPSASTIFFI